MLIEKRDLLERARAGDQDAFGRLIEPHHAKLHAHCYRMLGSVHDADDAIQETMLRAWRAFDRFDGRSAVGTWLYRIATNCSLNAIKKRPKRVLPLDYGSRSSDPADAAAPPVLESIWVEPYPDELLAGDENADPEGRFGHRESLELAFVAALQNMPPNQRAALILSEVLGFSAKETAEALETTTASINSALQRARQTIDQKLPPESQQATLRALGDEELNSVVESYIDAMERADVSALVGMLSQESTWSMPPQRAWFRGHRDIAAFAVENPFKYFRWRLVPVRSNGQLAFGCYTWDEAGNAYIPHALNVLRLDSDGLIDEVITFLDVSRRGVEGAPNFAEDRTLQAFGLPDSLPA